MTLSSLDVIIIVILFAGAYLGYSRGLLAELIALVGVVLGISLGAHFYLQTAEVLLPVLRNPEITSFIAYLVIYWAGVLAFFLFHLVVKSNMAGGAISPLSRIFATFLGAFKSLIFVVMVLFLVVFFWGSDNYLTPGAQFTPRVLPHCQMVLKLLPKIMQEPLEVYLNELSTANKDGEVR